MARIFIACAVCLCLIGGLTAQNTSDTTTGGSNNSSAAGSSITASTPTGNKSPSVTVTASTTTTEPSYKKDLESLKSELSQGAPCNYSTSTGKDKCDSKIKEVTALDLKSDKDTICNGFDNLYICLYENCEDNDNTLLTGLKKIRENCNGSSVITVSILALLMCAIGKLL